MGTLSPLLAAKDIKETIDYYQNVLGFTVGMTFPDARNPEYVDLSRDGMVIMFIPATQMGISGDEQLGVGVNLYLQIDCNVDEYYNELTQRNVKIVNNIKDEPFGIRDFTIEDINGYKLTFNQITARACMSCGMPMAKLEDFGGGNPSNTYCVHCTNPDGSLKSYDEVYSGMIQFMINIKGMDQATAEQGAREYMANMPAWSGRDQ